ncbi:MAG TPA: GAF domain-containing protein, partial [Longimicrobiaceae bacterium]|nr:GAF domain-containing protein [Longimicrobiaceae bacterium]
MTTVPPQATHSPDWKWEFLARAGAILSSSLDYDATLREVTRLAVERLADWCAFDELGSDGRIRRIAVAHPDPERVALAYELEERYPADPNATYGVPQVLRTGEPELVQEIPDEFLRAGARDEEHLRLARELGLKAYYIVPLKARGEVLGALTLVSAESGRRFGPVEQEVAQLLAKRTAVALDHARLYREAEWAREAAQASEADIREILEGLGEPLVVYDAEWRFRYVNSAAEAVFAEAGRREPRSLVGEGVWDLYPGLVGSRFEQEMRRVQEGGVAVSFEQHYPRSGTWVEI